MNIIAKTHFTDTGMVKKQCAGTLHFLIIEQSSEISNEMKPS